MHACSAEGLNSRAPATELLTTPAPDCAHLSQIEFYFSDSNLPRDKFLQEQVAADAEGYVDITLLSIFQRVRSLLKSTITDPANVSEQTVADVADALEGSSSLALSADRKRVRRAAALKDSGEVGGGSERCCCSGLPVTCWGGPPAPLGIACWAPQRGALLSAGFGRQEAPRPCWTAQWWQGLCRRRPCARQAGAACAHAGLVGARPRLLAAPAARAPPCPCAPQVAREVDERSLYASPFPFDATLDALSEFFRQHGSVQCVRMRRHMLSKDFNGSVFVEFSSVEEADKVGHAASSSCFVLCARV